MIGGDERHRVRGEAKENWRQSTGAGAGHGVASRGEEGEEAGQGMRRSVEMDLAMDVSGIMQVIVCFRNRGNAVVGDGEMEMTTMGGLDDGG